MTVHTTAPEIRCTIEFRQDDTRLSPGRLTGVLLQYGKQAHDRAELFATDALSWPNDGIILNLSHDRKQPIMRFTPEIRGTAVMVDVALPDTSRGRDAAEMVRNGTLRGLSVEFRATGQEFRNGLRRITKATLQAAALVDDASYGNSVELRRKRDLRLDLLWQ